jgi:predicted PurR-regulated permease PerM
MTPVGDVAQILVGLLFTLVFFAFLFHFRHEIRDRLFEIAVEDSHAPRERELVIVGAGVTVRRYLWIKFVMSVATGTVIGLASWAMGLDFPLVWALIAVGLNFIPSLGPMLAVLPAALVALVQGGFAFGLLVTAVMTAIHFLSGNVIEPIIVGYRLRLNFLVVLLSLFVWGLVWGFAGMVLAVPITACIKLALDYSGRKTALGTILGSPHEPALPEVPAPRPRARSRRESETKAAAPE